MTKSQSNNIREKKVFTSLWKNGARIEVFHYENKIEGEYELDRIQVLISPEGSAPRGWLFTAEEAVDLIYGLSKAVSLQLEKQNIYQEAVYRLEETEKAILKYRNDGYSENATNLVMLKERASELRGLLSLPEGEEIAE